MLKLAYFFVSCGLVVCIFFAFEQRAYAYVDPGSSLVVFQGVSSVVMGVLYYFRKRLKGLMTRTKTPQASTNGEAS